MERRAHVPLHPLDARLVHYILNWGLAALVYLVVGHMVGRALARI
jgi:hypothetical protein